MNTLPNIIVSSTCYDLHQIREALEKFIRAEMGYIPLLSEHPSFPIDPDQSTIENCRNRVEKNADLMVLVIGGRYGSIDPKSNKSITNLEFLAARGKGIPVYSFVDKEVLEKLPEWIENPHSDFTSLVDSHHVFEFVRSIRDVEKIWIRPFKSASDIISELRLQFAFLFQDSLSLRKRLAGKDIPKYLESLSPKSFRLALEKPPYWEHKLFLQSFADETEKRRDMLLEYNHNLRLHSADRVSIAETGDWLDTRRHELEGLIQSINTLFSEALPKALGPTGMAGDTERIVQISAKMGEVLQNLLLWARRVRCAHVSDIFTEVARELSLTVAPCINQIVSFPSEQMRRLEEALSNSDESKMMTLHMILTLELSNVDSFAEALESAKRKLLDG